MTIIVTGVLLLSFYSVQIANDRNRASLEERTATIAAALDVSSIKKLKGDESDLNNEDYKSLKTKLAVLRQVNTDARTIYLTGTRDGELFFFVDSEKPESQYYSEPGEAYPEASNEFKNIFFSTPFPVVEGPLPDSYGTWVSGLAPIFDRQTGKVVAVVGIDIDSVSFNQNLLSSLALPLLGGLILTIVVLVYEWIRRRDKQLLELRSELVSIASHELRTPLVGIRWALETFLKRNSGDNVKNIRSVYDSIIHLQAGTDDILQFTALTQRNKLAKEPTNLRDLMTEICDAQRLVGEQKNVKLVVDDSVPADLKINCDPVRMRRALHNVVSNAIKYTRSNTDVVLSYKQTDKEYQISIADHGIGIPKLEQQRVFAGFYRASNAKASGVGGTGLGLYLTRVIMGQHHGHITFESKEGEGTTFILSLPIKEPKMAFV
jgi:signal transduction histidine kinase